MKPFEILQRESILNSPWMPIERQTVRFPNGEKGEWYLNMSQDAVIVIPFLVNGNVLMQKAYKHGAGTILYEFCAGMIDEGESPEEAAKRELLEETGYQAESLLFLGNSFANPTGSPMRYHYFLGKNCVFQKSPELEVSEQIENFSVENLAAAKTLLTDPLHISSVAALSGITLAEQYFLSTNGNT